MVEPEYPGLSIRRQCDSLGISRSGWYSDRNSQPSEKDIMTMNAIDRIQTK